MGVGLGHNNGPTMEGGHAFRKYAWGRARRDLLPTLPIEVLRVRVRRAKALGLPYKTYASVRASTGRDVVGFLFSNNALRVLRPNAPLPDDRAEKLAALEARLAGLAHKPVSLAHLDMIQATGVAPGFSVPWSDIRQLVQAPVRQAELPLDGVLVIGDTTLERDWSEAGKLAGYLSADRFFASS